MGILDKLHIEGPIKVSDDIVKYTGNLNFRVEWVVDKDILNKEVERKIKRYIKEAIYQEIYDNIEIKLKQLYHAIATLNPYNDYEFIDVHQMILNQMDTILKNIDDKLY